MFSLFPPLSVLLYKFINVRLFLNTGYMTFCTLAFTTVVRLLYHSTNRAKPNSVFVWHLHIHIEEFNEQPTDAWKLANFPLDNLHSNPVFPMPLLTQQKIRNKDRHGCTNPWVYCTIPLGHDNSLPQHHVPAHSPHHMIPLQSISISNHFPS